MANMTVGECKKAILRLLNQYSIAGTVVPDTYNDQSDDIARMVDLINDAQLEIAITAKPITEEITVVVPQPQHGDPLTQTRRTMPADFIRSEAVYFKPLEGREQLTRDPYWIKWIGDNTILIPNKPAGEYTILYNRYPERYASDVADSQTLDNTPDTHAAIPYFCAAMIALDDNAKAYYSLYNVWETRLSRLGIKTPHALTTTTEDVYGLNGFGGFY